MSLPYDPNNGQAAGLNAGALASFSSLNIENYNKSNSGQKLYKSANGVLRKRMARINSPSFSPKAIITPFTVTTANAPLTVDELINGCVFNAGGGFANGNSLVLTLPPIQELFRRINFNLIPKAPTYAPGTNRSYMRYIFTLKLFRTNDVVLRTPNGASPFAGHAGSSGYAAISTTTGAITDLPVSTNRAVKITKLGAPNEALGTQQTVYFIVLQNSDAQTPVVAFFTSA
jgi:hypothetical protein